MISALNSSSVSRHFILEHLTIFRRILTESGIDVGEFPVSVANVCPAGVVAEWRRLLEVIRERSDPALIPMAFDELARRSTDKPQATIDTILASEFYQHGQGTMFVVSDIQLAAQHSLDSLVDAKGRKTVSRKGKEKIVPSEQETLHRQLMRDFDLVKRQYQKEERELHNRLALQKIGDDERARQTSASLDHLQQRLVVEFPAKYKIGTRYHKMSVEAEEKCESTATTNVFGQICDIQEMGLGRTIELLYLAGVGVYSQTLPSKYRRLVIDRFNAGNIKVLISDPSSAYGLNLQANKLIVKDSVGNHVPGSTLFQLIGRLGRLGLTDTAQLYVGPMTELRMRAVFHGASVLTVGPGQDPLFLIKAARERAERERIEAEAKAERERIEAEAKAERERIEAEAKAERDRVEAEAKAQAERENSGEGAKGGKAAKKRWKKRGRRGGKAAGRRRKAAQRRG